MCRLVLGHGGPVVCRLVLGYGGPVVCRLVLRWGPHSMAWLSTLATSESFGFLRGVVWKHAAMALGCPGSCLASFFPPWFAQAKARKILVCAWDCSQGEAVRGF